MRLRVGVFLLFLVSFLPESALAGPDNIAPLAKVTASSELNSQYPATAIIDGVIGVADVGEWACEGQTTDWGYVRYPWIKLEWKETHRINRIVLYDRPTMKDHIAGGKLIFSDGSSIRVNEIPNNGDGKEISLEQKKVRWIK